MLFIISFSFLTSALLTYERMIYLWLITTRNTNHFCCKIHIRATRQGGSRPGRCPPAQPWAAGSAAMLCYTTGNSQSMGQYVNQWRFMAVSVYDVIPKGLPKAFAVLLFMLLLAGCADAKHCNTALCENLHSFLLIFPTCLFLFQGEGTASWLRSICSPLV